MENKFLTGLKAGRNGPSYQHISKEAKALLVEEVKLLREVISNQKQMKVDHKFSQVEKFLAEGHVGNYWIMTAKRRSALGKRTDREDDNDGGGVMQMSSSPFKRLHND